MYFQKISILLVKDNYIVKVTISSVFNINGLNKSSKSKLKALWSISIIYYKLCITALPVIFNISSLSLLFLSLSLSHSLSLSLSIYLCLSLSLSMSISHYHSHSLSLSTSLKKSLQFQVLRQNACSCGSKSAATHLLYR